MGAPEKMADARETFDRDYVLELRHEAANYRVRVRELERENASLRRSRDRMADRLDRALRTNKQLREEAMQGA